MKKILLTALFFLFLTPAAFAEDAPVPERKTMSLESVRKLLSAEQQNVSTYDKERKKAENQLDKIRDDLSALVIGMRQKEKDIALLEERIQSFSAKEQDITTQIQSDYGSMASTILALQRLDRMPPEAVVLRPGAPLETAQAAIVLKRVLPALENRAAALAKTLEELEAVRTTLQTSRETTLVEKEKLEDQRAKLDKAMAEREKIFKSANKNYKESVANAERLAAQASSLQDLVKKLDQEETRRSSMREEPEESPRPKLSRRMPKGSLPVEGRILVGYGQKDDIGAVTEGIKITASPGSVVTAPAAGKVLFSGPFRNYGQLIIIEHRKGFHSLVAGMAEPSVAVGQRVSAAEPLGYMASRASHGENLTLYYEVRRNGDPVDPAILFTKLGS